MKIATRLLVVLLKEKHSSRVGEVIVAQAMLMRGPQARCEGASALRVQGKGVGLHAARGVVWDDDACAWREE